MRHYSHELGCFVTNIFDLEGVVSDELLTAIDNTYQEKINVLEQKAKENKEQFIWEERYASDISCQNTNAYNEVNEIIEYVENSTRLDRKKLIKMLEEIKNTLENY